jgi:hypothetical protein
MATHNGGIGSNTCTGSNMCFGILFLPVHCTSGIGNIGKYTTGTQKYIIITSNTGVNTHIILHFNIVSQNYAGADNYILANITGISNGSSRHDMAEMPNFGSLSYYAAFIDYSGFVRKKFCHGLHSDFGQK